MNWNKYPFLKLVVPLALGILLGDCIGPVELFKTLLYGVLVGLLLLEVFIHLCLKSYRHRWIAGTFNIVVFVFLGFFRIWVVDGSRMEASRPPEEARPGWYLAKIAEPPLEKEKSVRAVLELVGSGKLMAYFQKTEEALQLRYGDWVAFKTALEPVPGPKNPAEFDYRKYLARQGVTWRVYLKEGDWRFTGVNEARPLLAFSYRFRERLLQDLQRCGVTEEAFGIAAAMLLGYDECLPAQVRQNFVAAGSMHILCVSGMHVGIVYLLASYLLSLLGRGRRRESLKRSVLLLLIWCYALITGLSPSVMRSALMISFLIFGELIHRKGFALNSVAASAFVLLLLDPHHLFAIGFQLSYVAVLGILLLQKPICNLLYFKSQLLEKAWEITSVSLAAQLATMPFTVFYFNQFTPYFWLSNLFLTPLSFAAILLGMTLLIVSWVPLLNVLLGKTVGLLLQLMNHIVTSIEGLPLALIKGLYMDKLQFALALLLLLLAMLFVALRKKRLMMELLVVSAFFALTLAWRSEQTTRQHQLVIYSLRNHTAIDLMEGRSHWLLCDEDLPADPGAIDYSLKGYWSQCQLSMNPTCYALSETMEGPLAEKKGPWLSFGGLLLAFWEPEACVPPCDPPLPVDLLLVRGRQAPDLRRVLQAYRMDLLVIDASVSEREAMEWGRQAEAMGISCHQIASGALLYNIENQ